MEGTKRTMDQRNEKNNGPKERKETMDQKNENKQ